MIKYLLALLLLVSELFAGSLLITDVDDTLKDSRVRDYWEMIKRGPKTGPKMILPGMKMALYHIMEAQGLDSLYYVSKMPKVFEDFHVDFLRENQFPEGLLITRGLQSDFKFAVISEIIENEKPDQVILIGDNGQADSEVYHKLTKHFSKDNIPIYSFIRKAYKEDFKVYKGQVLFRDGYELVKYFQ